MIWLLKILGGGLGRYIVGGVIGLLIVSLAATGVQSLRLGHAKHDLAEARAGRDAWKKTADKNQALAEAWAKRAGQSEGLRKAESKTAVAAVNATETACAARVDAARRSADAIIKLISKEPRRDPQGCPIRELLDARSLRNATRPATD
jgi:hypothetical protein